MLKDNLKKFRKKAALTQQKLADLSGVSYSTITKLENGTLQNPSSGILAAIAIVLKVHTEDLVPPTSKYLDPFSLLDEQSVKTLNSNGFYAESWEPENTEQGYKSFNNLMESLTEVIYGEIDKQKMLDSFMILNTSGQIEAVNRIEELTHIEKYRSTRVLPPRPIKSKK